MVNSKMTLVFSSVFFFLFCHFSASGRERKFFKSNSRNILKRFLLILSPSLAGLIQVLKALGAPVSENILSAVP